ncbi:hypothetical protein ACOMHN_030430 [Nucella lapillus]
MISQNSLSELTNQQTEAVNQSAPQGCVQMRVREREFNPWNNPDNLVSRGAVEVGSKVRSDLILILFLIGGPANVINMAVFFKQGLRERVNILLFSLSLSDELYLVISLLNNVDELILQFSGQLSRIGSVNTFLVNNHLVGFFGFGFVSFVLSAIIACERCYCVLRPLQYQTALRTRTLVMIVITVNGLVFVPFFVIAVRYYVVCLYDPETGAVTKGYSHRDFYRNNKDVIDYMDSIIFGAGFPTLMMVVVTMATGVTIWKLGQLAAWRAQSSSAAMSAREVALTKMLAAASVLLVLCASPGCAFRLAGLFLPEMNTGRRHQNLYLLAIRVTHMFLYVNCSSNIFVYYAMGSRYRETFWALFRGRARDKKVPPVH